MIFFISNKIVSRKIISITSFIVLFTIHLTASSTVLNVKDFGTLVKKGEYATTQIQKAIDSCAITGGGTVVVPAGEYLCSTIILKDNVTLELLSGATVLASNKQSDYNKFVSFEDTGGGSIPILIYAEKANNISIRGNGKLKGQPTYYMDTLNYSTFIDEDYNAAKEAGVDLKISRWEKPNVSLIVLSECTNVKLENISIIDSPFWGVHLHWCSDVQIKGLKIKSKLNVAANSDGIDIDGCQNVTVSDCIIETADDAICLKTTKNKEGTRDCENIVVNNCILTSSSCALKIGTESYGDFSHIIFSNCVIRNSNRGLGIFIRDGGTASNIIFTDITIECNRKPVGWWGSADAFRFVVMKRNENSKIGLIKNVMVKDIIAFVQGSARVTGYENIDNIQNINFHNLQFFITPESTTDIRAKEAFSIKNASDILLDNVKINWIHNDEFKTKWTNSFIFENIHHLNLRNIYTVNQPNGFSPLLLLNVKKITKTNVN